MSAGAVAPTPRPRIDRLAGEGARAPRRPRLRIVPVPLKRAPRAPFVVLVIALLGGGLVSLLVLNTQRGQDAFTLAALNKQSASLQDQVQTLQQLVQQDQTPASLASRAAALGMVAGGDPLFIDGNGKVLGVVAPGTALPGATSPRVGNIVVAGTARLPQPVPIAPVVTPTVGTTATAKKPTTRTTTNRTTTKTPVAHPTAPTVTKHRPTTQTTR